MLVMCGKPAGEGRGERPAVRPEEADEVMDVDVAVRGC